MIPDEDDDRADGVCRGRARRSIANSAADNNAEADGEPEPGDPRIATLPDDDTPMPPTHDFRCYICLDVRNYPSLVTNGPGRRTKAT